MVLRRGRRDGLLAPAGPAVHHPRLRGINTAHTAPPAGYKNPPTLAPFCLPSFFFRTTLQVSDILVPQPDFVSCLAAFCLSLCSRLLRPPLLSHLLIPILVRLHRLSCDFATFIVPRGRSISRVRSPLSQQAHTLASEFLPRLARVMALDHSADSPVHRSIVRHALQPQLGGPRHHRWTSPHPSSLVRNGHGHVVICPCRLPVRPASYSGRLVAGVRPLPGRSAWPRCCADLEHRRHPR